GSAPSSRLRAAGIAFAQTANPPSPSSISPDCMSFLAVATASPLNSFEEPVASPRRTADRTLTDASRPMRWKGRQRDAYQPDGSVSRPYCLKHARAYLLCALNVTNTPYRTLLKTSRPSGSWLAAISTRPERAIRPPSTAGRNTLARSWTPAGGNASPPSGQSRPRTC